MAKNYGQKVHHWRQSILLSCLIQLVYSCSTDVSSRSWSKLPAGIVTVNNQSHHLKAFELSTTEVTNAEFQKFVNATNYITKAERDNYGGVVYKNGQWSIDPEANWNHPRGASSSIEKCMNHPVVQVTYYDAMAYCKWANVRLPNEFEWRYASEKGGGDQEEININHGFEEGEDKIDGFVFTNPVDEFTSSSLALYGMFGNVWEITTSRFDINSHTSIPAYVMKGGSFLCDATYCKGYTSSSRQSITPNDAYFHVGFRVARD